MKTNPIRKGMVRGQVCVLVRTLHDSSPPFSTRCLVLTVRISTLRRKWLRRNRLHAFVRAFGNTSQPKRLTGFKLALAFVFAFGMFSLIVAITIMLGLMFAVALRLGRSIHEHSTAESCDMPLPRATKYPPISTGLEILTVAIKDPQAKAA